MKDSTLAAILSWSYGNKVAPPSTFNGKQISVLVESAELAKTVQTELIHSLTVPIDMKRPRRTWSFGVFLDPLNHDLAVSVKSGVP